MTSTRRPQRPPRLGLRAAPWLLWYGVLGAATAWSLHMIVDWGINETVCRSGHDQMVGVPLRPLLAGLTLFFLALALASTWIAWRHWRELDRSNRSDDFPLSGAGLAPDAGDVATLALRRRRASFMALVGLVLGVLFDLMLIFSAIAILVLPACGALP